MDKTAKWNSDQQHQRPPAWRISQPASTSDIEIVDNRPEAVAQRKLGESINDSPLITAQRQQLRSMFGEAAQLQDAPEREELPQGSFYPIQGQSLDKQFQITSGCASASRLRDTNNKGLPDNLKSGIEALSGLSMDDVNVHYQSSKPAQLHAWEYAEGTDVHIASGQEKHLPHEAWNLVQQVQGRVPPRMQMKNRVSINDDKGLGQAADATGAKAAAVVVQAGGPSAGPRDTALPIQAKTKEEIARHGSFDVGGAKYRLLEGEGCEISIKFKLGTGIPAGTKISFIQAIRTITTHTDESVTSAQKVGGQEPAEGFERLDQFKGNPSAYYLDYIDEKLVPLINLASLDEKKRPYNIRSYDKYKEHSMEPVGEDVFNNFWDKFDKNRLEDLITVQTDTSSDTEKMSQGKKLDEASLFNLFNLFSSDIDAQIYDMPKDNLKVPKAIGDVSTCLFHTAAVTKVKGGDATVWDIVQWGYEITMVGDKDYEWRLIPMKPVAFDSAMLSTALAKMKETTTGYIGPDRLVKPD